MEEVKAKKRFLSKYSVFDIIIIAICASLGIAIKPVLVPLVHIITGPLFIPGGAVAGGFYMLFIVLAAGLVKRPFSATLECVVQAILVIVTGVIGSHGIMSLATYILPGLFVDLFLLIFIKRKYGILIMFFCGVLANVTGSFLSNVIFFRLPIVPLMVTLYAAAISGGLGGVLAYYLVNRLRKFNPAFKDAIITKNEEKNVRSKIVILISIFTVFVVGLGVFVFLNNDNLDEKQLSQKNATVTVSFKDEKREFDLEFLKQFDIVSFSASLDKDGQDGIDQAFGGVLISDVLDDIGIDIDSDDDISFIAADGYTTVCKGREIIEVDNIYLVYMRDGKPSGTKENGGTGPIEVIIKNDQFFQRWCKFLMEINIQ